MKGMISMEHIVTGLQMKTFKTGRQVVDWLKVNQFTVDGYGVKVLFNEMVLKVAKTSGKERKERRLTVTIDGTHSLEVGTESVKKGSFIKRLLKITELVAKTEEAEQSQEEMTSFDQMLNDIKITTVTPMNDEELQQYAFQCLREAMTKPNYDVNNEVQCICDCIDEDDFDLDALEAELAM